MSDMTHIDDWIDNPSTDTYASWFFNLKRMPAIKQFKFEEQISKYQLYCDYRGERYRVTGASSMGDVWITKSFDRDHGYDYRVMVDKCTNWSDKP